MATKTKVNIDIDITPDMLAAGLQVLVDSGVLDRGAGRELRARLTSIERSAACPPPGRRGRCPPRPPPTDPDAQISRIRFLTREIRSGWCSGG